MIECSERNKGQMPTWLFTYVICEGYLYAILVHCSRSVELASSGNPKSICYLSTPNCGWWGWCTQSSMNKTNSFVCYLNVKRQEKPMMRRDPTSVPTSIKSNDLSSLLVVHRYVRLSDVSWLFLFSSNRGVQPHFAGATYSNEKITWNNPKKDVSFSYKPLRRFSEQHLAKVIRQHGWNLSFWALIVAVLSYYPRGYFCFVVISDTHVEGKCYDYRWTMLQCFPLKELITWMKNKVLSCFLEPMFYMIFLLWNDLQAEKVSEEEEN